MQPLLSSREAPEVDLRPAGSGLVEVLLDCELPTALGFNFWSPRGGEGTQRD